MKRKLLWVLVLAALVGYTGLASETTYNAVGLIEELGVDPYLAFYNEAGALIAKLVLDESDPNAVCMVWDLVTGGSTYVPVMLLAAGVSNYGYFNGQTQPAFAIEDLDGDSWIRFSFSADDTPAITVGGAASTISIPAITGYSWTDDVDLAMGTGSDVSFEFTTIDANAHYLMVDLPTGGAESVPVMGLVSADADLGYFNGVVEPTFFVENLAGSSYISLDFSATTLARLIGGGSITSLSVTGPVGMTHTYGNAAQTGAMSFGASTAAMTVNVATGTGVHTVHIADGAAANVVTIGSTTTMAAVTLQSGTGDVTITSTDDGSFTVTDDLTLNGGSSGSVITIGGNTDGNVITIGLDDTTADDIDIGSAKDDVLIGGEDITLDTADDADVLVGDNFTFTMESGGGILAVTGTAGFVVNVGTDDSVADDINIGSAKDDITLAAEDITLTTADDVDITSTSALGVIALGGTPGVVINVGVDDTTADTITVGSAKDTISIDGVSVAVGSVAGASATVVRSGTGDLSLTSTDDWTATASGAVALFSNAVEQTITLGNETGASSVAIKAGTGNITVDGVAATTITVGDAAQTGTIKLGESSAAMELDLGTGTGAHAIHIGDGGTAAQVVTMGSTSAASALTLQAGSGDVSIASGDDFTTTALGTVNLFASAAECLVTLGNSTGASSLSLLAGTGNINMEGVAATTITIGDAAQTGRIAIGESTATMTDLSLGTGVGAHTIHIGDGGTAAQVITMGSTSVASGVTIQAGTGDVSITSADDWTATASGAVALFSNAVEQTITLGNATGASSVALIAGTGDITATTSAGAGAVVGATCTAAEQSINGIHKTVLTIGTLGNIALEDKDDGGGIQIYDFPDGVISILGASCNLVVTSDAAITTSYVMSLGSVVGTDAEATLTSTEANIIPSTVVTCGAGNEDFHGALLVPIGINGGGTAVDLYVNAAVAGGDISAGANVTAASGTITIYWLNAGDF